jgi:4-deoxy-L-threo-5-hexosulose-uronate ketol-isomerase
MKNIEQRYATSPKEVEMMNTEELRENFLIESVFVDDMIEMTYSHYERMIIGGAMPVSGPLKLETYAELRSDYFLERREIGIINIGGKGTVMVDGQPYELEKLSCLYVGKGCKDVLFDSDDEDNPAMYYLYSAPAHVNYPTTLYTKEQALPMTIGTKSTANERTIYKYIHKEGIPSCQIVMGLTTLHDGSVWNTMPTHVHDRRSEAYLYFDVPENQAIMHFMGHPQETRHLKVNCDQAIISPPWSIHSGAGTSNYSFIWAMAGENQDYTDMDAVPLAELL